MSQQINLFNPIFLKQKKYFSAVTMVQALGLILAGSSALAVYLGYQASDLRTEAEATSAQLISVQAQLSQMNAIAASRQKSQTLEDEVQKMEADTKSLQQVFGVLQKGDIGNTKGYAEYMRAFARQAVRGVWLTGFSIHGAGSEIALQGRALKADLVPVYLSRLKREPVLQGKSFSALEMQAPGMERKDVAGTLGPQASAGYIEFSLQSAGASKEQGERAGAKSK